MSSCLRDGKNDGHNVYEYDSAYCLVWVKFDPLYELIKQLCHFLQIENADQYYHSEDS